MALIPKRRAIFLGTGVKIKDFRRAATRYDKLAAKFLSAAAPAVLLAFWL